MRWISSIIIILVLLVVGAGIIYKIFLVSKDTNNPILQVTASPISIQSPSPTPVATSSAVVILEPKPNSFVKSPFTIKGQAPGSWLFEGQTTAKLERKDGTEIAQAVLLAETEWMTVEQVAFSGSMKFTKPAGVTEVNLIIEKSNPSGLPENADLIRIPLKLNKE
jgi:hypothetical protein